MGGCGMMRGEGGCGMMRGEGGCGMMRGEGGCGMMRGEGGCGMMRGEGGCGMMRVWRVVREGTSCHALPSHTPHALPPLIMHYATPLHTPCLISCPAASHGVWEGVA